tara:strand:- start:654 stop:764 length:111 start_codon:yes stop_codon:yes gene_type:complete
MPSIDVDALIRPLADATFSVTEEFVTVPDLCANISR